MAIPDFQTLMLPVLKASATGEVRIGPVTEKIADEFNLSTDERTALLPSGQQTTISNRVQWAKSYLGKAGLIELTRRGHFRITNRGQDVLASSPARIDIAFLQQFDEFRLFQKGGNGGDRPVQTGAAPTLLAEAQTPDELMRAAYRQIETALAQELLECILQAPPEFFERLVVNLLLAMGFGGTAENAGRALGRSGDDGVDGVIDQDALGLDRIYIQAKRYTSGSTIGSGAIRDFFGSLDRHKATKGLFVTTSSFTASAKETADFLSKRIVLIDGGQLTRLMIRHNVGCRVEETLHIRKLDEEFFE